MAWTGKIIGAIIGSVAGPVGTLVGGAIGHLFDEAQNDSASRPVRSPRKPSTYSTRRRTSTRSAPRGKTIYSKVVGVSLAGRQTVAKSLRPGDALTLVRERDNRHDPNAIAVYAGNRQLGYIKKELAARLAPEIDRGVVYDCKVEAITGGGQLTTGVNIRITKKDHAHSPNRAPSARKTSSGYRANSYDAFGYDDDYEDDYIAPEFKAANYYGYNYDSDYRDWVPGEPAPWDPCDADPDICCGYDH